MFLISNKCDFIKIFIKKSISSLGCKALSIFSSTLLVRNQSKIDVDATTHSTTSFSHIL